MAALLAQAPAFAQEAEAQADSAQAAAPQPADSPTELDAVVVTAQGREEDILAVPYNISVVSREAIQQRNILDTAELFRGVAGGPLADRGARHSRVVTGTPHRVRHLARLPRGTHSRYGPSP